MPHDSARFRTIQFAASLPFRILNCEDISCRKSLAAYAVGYRSTGLLLPKKF